MLHDLVARMVRAAANDPRLLPGLVVLDRYRVLAHVLEPDRVKCASAVAVHAFGLVLADDGVLEGCAVA